MINLKEDITANLKDIKGSGKFISIHTADFLFPGLEVDGVGEISYPVNEAQAKALIQVAQKAPFGKGSKTILDDSVRNTWEIDAAMLAFNNKNWAVFLDNVISKIKPDLGLEDYTIEAHLYKMLIYEKGGFFLPHKDSEKEKGMFGSLIIGLPSRHTGGELVVSFEGTQEVASFAETSGGYSIRYAAFYADCDHEVKPVTSGYRICLAYNLIQQKEGKKIQLQSLETQADKLAEIFVNHQQRGHAKPYIILLGHQYTPENFSARGLKLNDRAMAEALLLAAKKAGYYAKMCLVTSYLTGAPKYDGDEDADADMAEVYDESLYIEHWLENEVPALSDIKFEEDDLITSFALKDDEPILKESTGYMGNYGPDLMHWYHYGAVMIWPPQVNALLLREQDTATQLEWINYFNKNNQSPSDDELSALSSILSTGLKDRTSRDKTSYNAIADWVINRKDETFFLELNDEPLQLYFTRIDVANWVKLIGFLPMEITEKVFKRVTQNINLPVMGNLLSLLRALMVTDKFNQLVSTQIRNLPVYFSAFTANPANKRAPATDSILSDLFWIERNMPQKEAWIKEMAETLTGYQERKYINYILAPQLLNLPEKTTLANKMLMACQQFLQQRERDKPQPPADWSRQMPVTTSYQKQWLIIKAFLESPVERVFEYRKKQNERDSLESAIQNVVIDLKTETIKKSSPHTLRITKTQAAFNNQMRIWNEDVELLNKIMQKTGRL